MQSLRPPRREASASAPAPRARMRSPEATLAPGSSALAPRLPRCNLLALIAEAERKLGRGTREGHLAELRRGAETAPAGEHGRSRPRVKGSQPQEAGM